MEWAWYKHMSVYVTRGVVHGLTGLLHTSTQRRQGSLVMSSGGGIGW